MPRLALPPSIRSARGYAVVAGTTAAVAVLALAGLPTGGRPALVFLAAVVLLLGMPHGAVDHLVARRLFALRGTRGAVLFYGVYLALTALYGLAWLAAPRAALVFFLLVAAYHFGQADLAYVAPQGRGARRALYFSRGLFLIGSPLLAHPEAVAPVVQALSGVALGTNPMLADAPGIWLAALTGQHAATLLLWAWREGQAKGWLGRELLTTAILATLFGAAHPLAAFALYFGLWHALGHILVLLRFFRNTAASQGSAPERALFPRTAAGFYRRAALYTLLPLAGLVGFLWIRPSGTAEGLAALFVLISVLTLPHMLLVERLYRHERRRYAQQKRRRRPAQTGTDSSSCSSPGPVANEGGSLDG